MILRGYETTLQQHQGDLHFQTTTACSMDLAVQLLCQKTKSGFDIVLLDILMPPTQDKRLINGEDLGLYLRKVMPQTKIIVQTGLNDRERIAQIKATLHPEGFFIKSEITPKVLIQALYDLTAGQNCYGVQADTSGMPKNTVPIDSVDRALLHYLSLGEKTKNLPKFIPLSLASIERRKQRLKLIFGIPKGNNRDLLEKARAKGLL